MGYYYILAEFINVQTVFLLYAVEDAFNNRFFFLRKIQRLINGVIEKFKALYVFAQRIIAYKIRMEQDHAAGTGPVRRLLLKTELTRCNEAHNPFIKIIILLAITHFT